MVRDKLAAITDWTAENVHHAIQATADELEVGMGKVGMPLRVAVTGAGSLQHWMLPFTQLVRPAVSSVSTKRWILLLNAKISSN